MNLTKIALFSFAALVFSGCGPKSLPSQWNGTSHTGETQNQFKNFSNDEESLTNADVRDETPVAERVAGWLSDNNIPENAKLAVVYFGFDKFNVEAGERGKLSGIIEAVNRGNVYIVGYSDYFGTEEYNLALSDKRAQAVKNYLKNLGANDSSQVQALGEAFAVQNGSKAEVAQDRKVIVVDGNAQ